MIRFWCCGFDYLHFEGYSWLICDLIWQDISNDRTGICREKERQKLAFPNGFSPAKEADVMGRDGAETRGLSSEGRGKQERQPSCSPQAPHWPPWTTLDESLCIYVPPPSLSYSFRFWGNEVAQSLHVWSLNHSTQQHLGTCHGCKFPAPSPGLLNQELWGWTQQGERGTVVIPGDSHTATYLRRTGRVCNGAESLAMPLPARSGDLLAPSYPAPRGHSPELTSQTWFWLWWA